MHDGGTHLLHARPCPRSAGARPPGALLLLPGRRALAGVLPARRDGVWGRIDPPGAAAQRALRRGARWLVHAGPAAVAPPGRVPRAPGTDAPFLERAAGMAFRTVRRAGRGLALLRRAVPAAYRPWRRVYSERDRCGVLPTVRRGCVVGLL